MLRTNYQKKFSSFNPKATQEYMSPKWLKDELDAIVRLILPLMESCCFTCGSQHGLQVGHLLERRHVHTRWDTSVDGNNHLQCPQCNQKHESHPGIYRNRFIDRFGPQAFEVLEFRMRSKQKLTKSDLLELLEEKQTQLKGLRGSK